jgi:hypothetical protein
MSKRDVATKWLLRGPVALPELCDLVCKYMLVFEGLPSDKLWDFPPSIVRREISLLDNDRVALFYGSTLEVREMYTGAILWTCVGHTRCISAAVDLGHGLIASSEFGGPLRVWRQSICITEIPAQIIALPGSRIASYTRHSWARIADNYVQVWTADGERVLSLKHTSKVDDISCLIALGNNEIAFGYGKLVCVVDATTGVRANTLHSRSPITRLFAMPHNRLAATSHSNFSVEASVWCLHSSTCLQTFDLVRHDVPAVLSDGTCLQSGDIVQPGVQAILSDGTFVFQQSWNLTIYDLVLNRRLLTTPSHLCRAMLPLKNGLVLKVSDWGVSLCS